MRYWIVGILLATAGCSSVPDAVNPVEWYRGAREAIVGSPDGDAAGTAEAAPAVPGGESSFPNLASVPEPPPTESAATRRAVEQGLVADRTHARYTDQVMREQKVEPPPPPPPPAPEPTHAAAEPASAMPPSAPAPAEPAPPPPTIAEEPAPPPTVAEKPAPPPPTVAEQPAPPPMIAAEPPPAEPQTAGAATPSEAASPPPPATMRDTGAAAEATAGEKLPGPPLRTGEFIGGAAAALPEDTEPAGAGAPPPLAESALRRPPLRTAPYIGGTAAASMPPELREELEESGDTGAGQPATGLPSPDRPSLPSAETAALPPAQQAAAPPPPAEAAPAAMPGPTAAAEEPAAPAPAEPAAQSAPRAAPAAAARQEAALPEAPPAPPKVAPRPAAEPAGGLVFGPPPPDIDIDAAPEFSAGVSVRPRGGPPPRLAAVNPRTLAEFDPRATTRSARVATIHYASGATGLDAAARETLRRVAALQKRDGGSLRVVGHASSQTRDMAAVDQKIVNFDVSLARAQAAAKALIGFGVPAARIFVGARGDSDPIGFEDTSAGEAANRRTEIFLDH